MGLKNFFQRIGAAIDEHTVVDDLEADLYAPGAGTKAGTKLAELEFKRFKPGHTEFEIELKVRAKIPEGEEVAVLIHGVEVRRVTAGSHGRADVKLFSKQGDEIPPIQLGDEAQIVHRGEVIASGVFKEDD